MANRSVLFSCGGLGMGNASRVFAIAQALSVRQPEIEIHLFSWGKGYEFLSLAISSHKNMYLHSLEAYPWFAPSRIPLFRASKILVLYALAHIRNSWILRKAMREINPALVLLDSDYHFASFINRRVKLYYLGQANDVLTRARQLSYQPNGVLARFSFFVCEALDAWIQRFLSDHIFVPSFLENASSLGDGKISRVPLIVRKEFQQAAKQPSSRKAIAIGSGSKIEVDRLDNFLTAIGGSWFSSIGEKLRITSPLDFQAGEHAVIQGGLSSISECIALKKPMIIVPIRGRAEQEINARTVESLGFGVSIESGRRLKEKNGGAAFSQKPPEKTILVNGADVIVDLILADA
jgi:hypothetical protein